MRHNTAYAGHLALVNRREAATYNKLL